MCPSSDAIASVYALQTGHGGRACGGTGHAAGSKAYRSCEESDARPLRTCGEYVRQQRATMDPTHIIAGAKALDKPIAHPDCFIWAPCHGVWQEALCASDS